MNRKANPGITPLMRVERLIALYTGPRLALPSSCVIVVKQHRWRIESSGKTSARRISLMASCLPNPSDLRLR